MVFYPFELRGKISSFVNNQIQRRNLSLPFSSINITSSSTTPNMPKRAIPSVNYTSQLLYQVCFCKGWNKRVCPNIQCLYHSTILWRMLSLSLLLSLLLLLLLLISSTILSQILLLLQFVDTYYYYYYYYRCYCFLVIEWW